MLMSKSCKPLHPGLFLLGAATAVLVFAAPQTCAAALRQGLALCGGPLLVSLFPFLVVSALIMRSGAAKTSAAVTAPSRKSPGYSGLQLLLISTPSPSIYMEAWAVQCTRRGTGGTTMARAHHDRRTPGDWLRGLFRQPPPGFYSRPAVYLSGDRMEIEHFCTVLFFDENKLCLRLAKGRFTVYGSGLRICTLTDARLTVQGQFLRTDFSDE